MKKMFKTLMAVTLLLLVVLFLAFPVQAQQYEAQLISSNALTTVTETNLASVLTLTKYEDTALQLSVIGTAATTNGNVSVTVQRSIDGVNYTAFMTLDLAANGATRATCISNVPPTSLGPVGYLKFTTVTNASFGTATYILNAAKKPKRFGN
jgi:hypothetical protein